LKHKKHLISISVLNSENAHSTQKYLHLQVHHLGLLVSLNSIRTPELPLDADG